MFPLYKDKRTVKKMIFNSLKVLKKTKKKFEIIIVDDGCPEKSGKFAKKLAKNIPSVKVVFHKKNLGYGAALKTGIKNCKYQWIFQIDGDAEYSVNDLPRLMKSSQNSDLVILAGRPSMGKTALATNIAFNAAKFYSSEEEKGSVVMFSLEMSAEQIGLRILAEQSKIPSDKLRKGELTENDSIALSETYKEIHNLKFFFDDSPNLTVSELRSKLRRYKNNYNIKLVLIDYLQLIKPEGNKDNRVNELSEITRNLKQLAKEFDLPVVSLSQLSRQVESRDDKRPLLSDLRESGSIEQDADVVMFIYRESYYLQRNEPTRGPDESQESYQKKHDAWKDRNEEVFNKAELIIAKQRNGPTGKVDLYFDDKYTKFLGMEK